jgi:hypothetical protein
LLPSPADQDAIGDRVAGMHDHVLTRLQPREHVGFERIALTNFYVTP